MLADPSGAAVVLTGTTPRVARTGLGDLLAGFATGWGAHCESCMSGGDKTVNHHGMRDDIYSQAKRAHTAPQLEASGVVRLLGLDVGGDTRERPADVLLC